MRSLVHQIYPSIRGRQCATSYLFDCGSRARAGAAVRLVAAARDDEKS